MTAAVQSMMDPLANLHDHIQMAFGGSEWHQGLDKWDKPTAGIGQGNGTGPQIWVAVSSPLFDIMWQEGLVMTFICTISKEHQELAGCAFVNDMDLIVNENTNKPTQVCKKMQASLTMWVGLLCATRGDLVPDKCFWYFLDFHWVNNHWKYKMIQEAQGQLTVITEEKYTIIIPWLRLWKPSEHSEYNYHQMAITGKKLDTSKQSQQNGKQRWWKLIWCTMQQSSA